MHPLDFRFEITTVLFIYCQRINDRVTLGPDLTELVTTLKIEPRRPRSPCDSYVVY